MTKNKFKKSFHLALKGIVHGFSKERNIKIQALIGILVIIISILLKIPKTEFLIILILSFLVIISELINTSLEKLIDVLHPRYNAKLGKIKDILAGVVLLNIILAVICGIIIFYPFIIRVIKMIF